MGCIHANFIKTIRPDLNVTFQDAAHIHAGIESYCIVYSSPPAYPSSWRATPASVPYRQTLTLLGQQPACCVGGNWMIWPLAAAVCLWQHINYTISKAPLAFTFCRTNVTITMHYDWLLITWLMENWAPIRMQSRRSLKQHGEQFETSPCSTT